MQERHNNRKWLPAVVLAALFISQLSAQTANAHDDRIDSFLGAFASDSETARSAAFYGLLSLGSTDERDHDRVTDASVELLQKENRFVQRAKANHTRLSEGFLNYYGELIHVVSTVREPAAIPALVGAIPTGNMATSGLAHFGDAAVSALLPLFASQDHQVRAGALYTVSKLDWSSLKREHQDDAERIMTAVLRAADDVDPFVRMAAVPAMKNINSAAMSSKLREMAASDPFRATYMKGRRFPVREAAAKALSDQGPRT